MIMNAKCCGSFLLGLVFVVMPPLEAVHQKRKNIAAPRLLALPGAEFFPSLKAFAAFKIATNPQLAHAAQQENALPEELQRYVEGMHASPFLRAGCTEDGRFFRLLDQGNITKEQASFLGLNDQDKDGKTVLHHMASVGSIGFTQRLLALGAEKNLFDKQGRIPCDYAATIDILDVLNPRVNELDRNFSVNALCRAIQDANDSQCSQAKARAQVAIALLRRSQEQGSPLEGSWFYEKKEAHTKQFMHDAHSVVSSRLELPELEKLNVQRDDLMKFSLEKKHSVERVKFLLDKQGVDIQFRFPENTVHYFDNGTWLHEVATVPVAELLLTRAPELLEQRSTVNHFYPSVTPLGAAVIRGNIDVARFLIAQGATYKPEDVQDWLSYLAERSCSSEGVKALRFLHDEFGVSLTEQDNGGNILLHRAGTPEMVEELLRIAPNTLELTNKEGRTPVLTAAVSDTFPRLDVARSLIEKGANVQVQDAIGMTLLHHLAGKNERKGDQLIDLLLKKGLDPLARDVLKKVPLHYAQGRKTVELLMNACPMALHAEDSYGRTLLHESALKQSSLLVDLLAQGWPHVPKADINAQDHDGRTPMHLLMDAIQKDNHPCSVARKLLSLGADVTTIKDSWGKTALDLLMQKNPVDRNKMIKGVPELQRLLDSPDGVQVAGQKRSCEEDVNVSASKKVCLQPTDAAMAVAVADTSERDLASHDPFLSQGAMNHDESDALFWQVMPSRKGKEPEDKFHVVMPAMNNDSDDDYESDMRLAQGLSRQEVEERMHGAGPSSSK